MEPPGRFVGVGIDVYEAHEALQHAVSEVSVVADMLRAEFAGEPLLDVDQAQVSESLKSIPGSMA